MLILLIVKDGLLLQLQAMFGPMLMSALQLVDRREGELIVETLNEKLMDSGEDSVTDWSKDLAGRSKLPGALLAWTLTKSGHIVHWSTIHTQHVTTRHHLEPACSR